MYETYELRLGCGYRGNIHATHVIKYNTVNEPGYIELDDFCEETGLKLVSVFTTGFFKQRIWGIFG